jgi:hypothetical protein
MGLRCDPWEHLQTQEFAVGAISSDVSAGGRPRSTDSDPALEAGASSRGGSTRAV